MGEFNGSCRLTNLPIIGKESIWDDDHSGCDEVYLIWVVQNTAPGKFRGDISDFNPCRYWKPIGLPIPAHYNAYGWVHLIDQEDASLGLVYTSQVFRDADANQRPFHGWRFNQSLGLDEPGLTDWQVIDRVSDAILGDYRPNGESRGDRPDLEFFGGLSNQRNPTKLSWFLVHKWAYDAAAKAVKAYFDTEGYWAEIIDRIEDESHWLHDPELQDRFSTGPFNWDEYEDVLHKIDMVCHQQSIFATEQWHSVIEGYETLLTMAYLDGRRKRGDKLTQEIAEGFRTEFMRLISVLYHCFFTGTHLIPPINYGADWEYLKDWNLRKANYARQRAEQEAEYWRETAGEVY